MLQDIDALENIDILKRYTTKATFKAFQDSIKLDSVAVTYLKKDGRLVNNSNDSEKLLKIIKSGRKVTVGTSVKINE